MTDWTIAHYRVLEKLGEGGMGVVYRAHDQHLNRDVAIKMLPDDLAHDSERLARFRREAHTLAALNHSNIAAIYGLEEHNGQSYLVLEYLPGETLADRLLSGPLPVPEALEVSMQIAEALEAAHEKGVVHRDLKPANVKVTPEGKVKVLDFGLAKTVEPKGADADPALSPTMSLAVTQTGVILGTAAYMSPEQARGKPVDKRTDIWAFGCVLYELLAGRRAFPGETVSDCIAAILSKEPDWSALPAETPAHARLLLRRCLQKDTRERLRDAGDALLELKQSTSEPAPLPATAPAAGRRVMIWAIAAAAFAVVALVFAVLHFSERPPEQQSIHLALNPPANTSFGTIAVSPDGLHVAFTAPDTRGNSQLWLRPLAASAAHPLEGTAGARFPFWSPDSRSIGFLADGKLKRVSASGGPPQTLANASGRGGAWSRDGVIVYSPGVGGPLLQIPATGGEPKPATHTHRSHQENSHRWPHFLPDGRRFLYLVRAQPEHQGIYVGSLDSGESDSKDKVRILATDSNAAYVGPVSGQGYLLYVRDRSLMAQRFDAHKLELSGEAFRVAAPVGLEGGILKARFSASATGEVLIFDAGGSHGELVWQDRNGKHLGTLGSPGSYFQVALSPDGRRAATSRTDPNTANQDIWLYDLTRGTGSRFTFHPAADAVPVWSPDGSRIIFNSSREGPFNLYEKLASGTSEEKSLLKTNVSKSPIDLSRDGRFLLYLEHDPETASDLWVLPLAAPKMNAVSEPFTLLRSRFSENNGRFSPDGKWVAYESNESGRHEIHVRAFSPREPGSGGEWQISTDGGVEPRWRGDGRELFYLGTDRKMMVVEVKAGTGFEAGTPRPLFQTRVDPVFWGASAGIYDVTADGQRFLIISEAEGTGEPATVILNWPAALKK